MAYKNGKIEIFNGLKSYWLEQFGDERKLTLALAQAAGFVQENSRRPLEAQVSSQLARMVRSSLDQDERYLRAAKSNVKGGAAAVRESDAERRARRLREMAQGDQGGRK